MLAIIPARGGSKGLPGKNMKPLGGKPLILHSIEAAFKSKYIDKVFVSTDNQEILDFAILSGAWAPSLRPNELATDTASAIDTYLYTLLLLEKEYGMSLDDVVVLQPTSPLRTADDINRAIELFREKEADSVVSYTLEQHPIYWHKEISEEGIIKSIFPDQLLNRQDYKSTYYPNGSIYIFKRKMIFEKRSYYGDNSFAYIMPRNRSVDIDTIEDFRYAEYLFGCTTK